MFLFGHYTTGRTVSFLELSRRTSSPAAIQKQQQEIHQLIRGITRQFVALSWLNVTPLNPSRLSVLPFHFAIAHRLAALVHLLDDRDHDKDEPQPSSTPVQSSTLSTPASTPIPTPTPASPVPPHVSVPSSVKHEIPR